MNSTASPPPTVRTKRLGVVLTVAALWLIGWATLRPGVGAVGGAASWTPSDVILNILLFLPLGVALGLSGLRARWALVLGLCCSAGVELAQLWWVPGRFASPVDFAANACGAAVGALAVSRWESRRRWWPWMARLVATMVVFAWLLGGYVAQPAIPGAPGWLVEWAPEGPDGGRFAGTVLDVELQHRPIPPGQVEDPEALRAQLMASRKTLFRVRFVWGDSTSSSPIAQVMVGEGRNRFLTIAQAGTTVRGYQRTGLWWVGLRTPWIELPPAFHASRGDSVEARLVATRHAIELEATVQGRTTRSQLRLSPELYFSAQWNRASGGAFWWWIVPGMFSAFLLGVCLARRWWLVVGWGGVSFVLSAVAAGCALPSPGMLIAAIVGAWGGVRCARALGLAGATATGAGGPSSMQSASSLPSS